MTTERAPEAAADGRPVPPVLGLAFFLSGAAGLVYQVAWQRLLFANFGVDVESTTVLVSAYMLGLGCGGWLGGRWADRVPGRALLSFCLFEAAIGLFGAGSPHLLAALGRGAGDAGLAAVAALNFVAILPATVLMGGTLPMLTAWLAKSPRHVGGAIGALYSWNTLGAALGCFAAAFGLFAVLDLHEAVRLAAGGNLAVAGLAWWEGRRHG